MNRIKSFFSLLKQTLDEFNTDGATRLAAALSYYTTFSIAPLLVIVIAIVGAVWGQQAVQNQIAGQLSKTLGEEGAKLVQELVQAANRPSQGVVASLLSVVGLFFGALGTFDNLKMALNIIWNVKEDTSKSSLGANIVRLIKDKFLSFGMLLIIGFFLLVSLVLSTVVSAFGNYMMLVVPGADFLLQVVNFIISFAITTGLFAAMFKVLPAVRLSWKDVIVGAILTSLLFSIGRFLLGQYLGRSFASSPYGVAGSLALILLWIYYSAQILLFGAEFTQVYSRQYGTLKYRSTHSVIKNPEVVSVAKEEHPKPPVALPAPVPPRPVLDRVESGINSAFKSYVMLAGLLALLNRLRGLGTIRVRKNN